MGLDSRLPTCVHWTRAHRMVEGQGHQTDGFLAPEQLATCDAMMDRLLDDLMARIGSARKFACLPATVLDATLQRQTATGYSARQSQTPIAYPTDMQTTDMLDVMSPIWPHPEATTPSVSVVVALLPAPMDGNLHRDHGFGWQGVRVHRRRIQASQKRLARLPASPGFRAMPPVLCRDWMK